ncbi:hypothetical protein T05_8027 [Trichinella murrelli]|uniref:Uncharacterized protein n=1 Tax=Trichinella murrelli TaxID=144512 RepID=A0A0V0T8T8_9BILA|nr:hypothetical protein T05_8027 [Trichinella murrelli]
MGVGSFFTPLISETAYFKGKHYTYWHMSVILKQHGSRMSLGHEGKLIIFPLLLGGTLESRCACFENSILQT